MFDMDDTAYQTRTAPADDGFFIGKAVSAAGGWENVWQIKKVYRTGTTIITNWANFDNGFTKCWDKREMYDY